MKVFIEAVGCSVNHVLQVAAVRGAAVQREPLPSLQSPRRLANVLLSTSV